MTILLRGGTVRDSCLNRSGSWDWRFDGKPKDDELDPSNHLYIYIVGTHPFTSSYSLCAL